MDNTCRGSEVSYEQIVSNLNLDIHDDPKPFPTTCTSVDSCVSMSSEEGDSTVMDEHVHFMDYKMFLYQMTRNNMTMKDDLGSYSSSFNLKHLPECRCPNCLTILLTTTDPHHLPISPLSFDKQQTIFQIHELLNTNTSTTSNSSGSDYRTAFRRRAGSTNSNTPMEYTLVNNEVEYDSSTSSLIMPLKPPPLRRRQSSVSERHEDLMKSVNKSIPPFRLTKPSDTALYREPCCEATPPPTPQSVLSILPFNTTTCESLAFTYGAQCCTDSTVTTAHVACDGVVVPKIALINSDDLSEDIHVGSEDDTCQISCNLMSSIFATRYMTDPIEHKDTCLRSVTHDFVIDLVNRGNLPPIQEQQEVESAITCVDVSQQFTLYCTCCKQESSNDNDKSKLLLDSSVSSEVRSEDDVTYLSILYQQYELDMQAITLYPCASIHPCSSYTPCASIHSCTSMGIVASEQVVGSSNAVLMHPQDAQQSLVGAGLDIPMYFNTRQCLANPDQISVNYSIIPVPKFVGID